MNKLKLYTRSNFIAIIPLLFALYSSSIVIAAEKCNQAEAAAANRFLWLNAKDQQLALKAQLPWGIPIPTSNVQNEVTLTDREYSINYDTDLLVPIWVAYRLEAKDLGNTPRLDCFRADPRLNAPLASLPSDYDEPIFDQGHLAPNGDMSSSRNPVLNSFIMSNMAPQFCQFNRGVWQILEALVRIWIKSDDSSVFYIISGSVFDRDGNGVRDDDAQAKRMKSKNGKARVAVPSHFYKILVQKKSDGSVKTISVLMPNDQTDLDGKPALEYIAKHITSIAEIQAIAGVKFFPDLADKSPSVEDDIIKTKAPELWPIPTNVKQPKTLANSPQCHSTAGFAF